MAITNVLSKENILKAMDYIDKNNTPFKNQSTNYDLVADSGKKYAPKYVVAVAMHLAYKTEISTEEFNSIEANKVLKDLGFIIEQK